MEESTKNCQIMGRDYHVTDRGSYKELEFQHSFFYLGIIQHKPLKLRIVLKTLPYTKQEIAIAYIRFQMISHTGTETRPELPCTFGSEAELEI